MKQKHEFKSIVAETLLIPLYMQAKESRRAHPILNDKAAERLADSLEYDYSQFDGARLSEVGCVVRGWYFDRAVRRFIDTHPRPVVVNVGCGLDTRYQRIGNGKAVFYDMDLPEVIALRRELIPEQPGNPYIAASLLETEWMDGLRCKHPDGAFIFIVEGVLMYFYEKQVRSFLHHVASRFGGGEIWFDVCGTMMSRHGVKPDSLRKHEAQIRSGLSNGHLVEQWEPALHLLDQANYMKFFRPRWGFFFGQILGRIPWLCYKFSSLLGYKILSK
ncbi:MAG TPA: class I SAM-dependent methyltransferase [Candidatus Bacteroides merdavium]|uniref:Class I SAM-dependent methyltransferase n=1 Tax=Candidatus Bacteroides merdavium TaxID=2838472 RepID=A0A9D2GYR3_9BACE|nr:class I SAM-dependent methyltransferase [Candidatus Bacteroides merdavium]